MTKLVKVYNQERLNMDRRILNKNLDYCGLSVLSTENIQVRKFYSKADGLYLPRIFQTVNF